MTTNIFDMSDTWNNGASTFNAIKMSVNNAGAAGDSKLIDLILGGSTRFNVGLDGTLVRGNLSVGIAGGNHALIQGTPAGGQSVIYGVDPTSSDSSVNVVIRSDSGVLLYRGGGLQMVATGPDPTTRYIQITGASGANNPRILAGGGGVVEIDSLAMTGNPTAPTQPASDSSTRVATTEFIKREKYVQAAPPTSFTQLAGFADPPDGTLIQGIDMPPFGLKKIGNVLALSDDLGALEALTGTHTIYYRSGLDTWTPVVVGPSLSFAGDTLDLAAGAGGVVDAEYIVSVSHTGLSAERVLTDTATITWDFSTPGQAKATSAAGGGNVSSVGTPAINTFAQWTGPTTIQSITGTNLLTQIQGQPLDAQLTAIAVLAPVAGSVPYYTSATAANMFASTAFSRAFMQSNSDADGRSFLLAAPIDSPAFTGTPTTTTPAGADSSTRIASTAFVKGQGYATNADITAAVATKQPLNANLTAYSNLTTVANTVPYFTGTSGAVGLNSLTPFMRTLLDDANATEARATLGVGSGTGDVTQVGNNAFTGNNTFNPANATVFGHTAPIGVQKLQINSLASEEAAIINHWSTSTQAAQLSFQKSRGATPGTHAIAQSGDFIGMLNFRVSNGTSFPSSAQIITTVVGAPAAGETAGAAIRFYTALGGGVTAPVRRMAINNDGAVNFGDIGAIHASISPLGVLSLDQATPTIVLNKAAAGAATEIRGSMNTLARWKMLLGDASAEGGGAGSNFQLIRCNDGGSNVDSPISANRQTGLVTIPALTAGLRGVADGSAGAVGDVGEYKESILGSFITPTVSVVTNIMSLALTAGDWDVWMTGQIIPAAQGTMEAELSASATLSGTFPNYMSWVLFAASALNPVSLGPFRFSSASPITVTLMVRAGAASQQISRAFIAARRTR